MPGTDKPSGPAPSHRPLMLTLGLAMVVATALIVALLWSARQDALRSAQRTALNYARTLEIRLDDTLRRTDSVQQSIAQLAVPDALAPHAEHRYADAINGQLDLLHRDFGELIALRVLDGAGEQRYVTDAANTPPANYADRAFFAALRDHPDIGVIFSEVVTGRVTGRPTVVMARALRDAKGRFYGAVLAPIDLGFFLQQFKTLDIGSGGVVFLRRTAAGELVLRWPQIESEINKPMPATQPILMAVHRGEKESVNEYVAFTDGVRRISGSVVVKGYPYFLTVALSVDDVLSGWHKVAWLTGLIWAALLVSTALLLGRLWRGDEQRERLQAQLRNAQRIESLGTLAGGIAHDFNNIVAAILGNALLASETLGADHPAQQNLTQIRKAGTRGRDLVQQILAFGRRQTHVLRSQPLQPLLEEAATLARSTLPSSTELRVVLPPERVHARVDATQIQQVLMNLCTNAVHAVEALPGHGGHIEVGLERLGAEDRAHLWVRDDGVGMDEATRARAFEPFFTTKPTGKGTGLGLSVVHGIMVAHDGSIRVDSEPGLGTTVHLYLPLSDPDPADSADNTETVATVPAPHQGEGRHVLYVDDDEVMSTMVEQLLRRAGYRVTIADSGRAAVESVERDRQAFDVVVTDFNMPGFTGLEVASALRRIDPKLPVVISSGYVSDDLREEAASLGVRALIQKQNTLEELEAVVRRALST